MATAIEYALMAGNAYRTTRDEINWIPAPQGWLPFFPVPDPTTASIFPVEAGFEAVSFVKGTEIVISYAGTDFSDPLSDFLHGNIPLALGKLSSQLEQAADYYLQVKALNQGAIITFTGHSLGGGIASLMAVLFGESAFTFDQGPFRNAARTYSDVDTDGKTVLRSASQALKAYLAGKAPDNLLAKLDAYIAATDPDNLNPNPADTLAAREAQVTNLNVQGEIVSLGSAWRIGNSASIPQGSSVNLLDVISFATNLHSQTLLTALLQSNQTTEAGKALHDVTFKLTDLLGMIFDEKLFAHSTARSNTTEENFLERLVKHEAGNGTVLPADAMVTRFTTDLWKIAQDGGLTLTDSRLSKALIAFAMQMYYDNTANATDARKTLFGSVTGGIQFDIQDVAATPAAIKGYADFRLFLEQYYTTMVPGVDGSSPVTNPDKNLILSALSSLRDWYVQAGASGLLATDTLNRGAVIPHSPSLAEDKNLFEVLGGVADDYLTGGSGADLLVGNAANDNAIHIGRIAA